MVTGFSCQCDRFWPILKSWINTVPSGAQADLTIKTVSTTGKKNQILMGIISSSNVANPIGYLHANIYIYIYYTYMRTLVQAAFDYRMASPIGVYPIPWGWLIVDNFDNRSLACDWAQSLASNMGVSSSMTTGEGPMGWSWKHGKSHNRNEHVQTSNIFVMQLCRLWYPNWDIGNSTLMIYTWSLCRSCDILCMIYI